LPPRSPHLPYTTLFRSPGRVAAWIDEVVLVGHGGRFRAPRVDHHQLAASLTQGLEPCADARGRHQAAVGGQRVAAEDEHEAGARSEEHTSELQSRENLV